MTAVAMADEVTVEVASDSDLVQARAEARALAGRLGFSRTDATLIATAISEIARNMVVHADGGEIILASAHDETRYGVQVVARDTGPGIPDIESALEEGVGTGEGFGLGLPGARRVMDEFEIDSNNGGGTVVTMRKWRVRDELERLREGPPDSSR
jgi:anti-sigma regulatory factor (Ser/Thr protein kinase)